MLSTVHDHGGVRIAYDRRPGDMPMVVLHGGSARRQQTAALLAFLPQVCDVVAPDLRGHGESSHTPGHYRLEDFAADIASLCDSVFGGAPVVIYGHSLGGQVALVLAAERPGLVRGIIAGDTPLSLATLQHATEPGRPFVTSWRDLAASNKSAEEMLASLEEMRMPVTGSPGETRPAREVLGPGHPYLVELAASLATHDPAFLEEAVLPRFTTTHRSLDPRLLLRFQAPVLLLRVDPAAGGLLTEEEARGARQMRQDVEVAVVPGVSHALHVQDPAAVAAVINPFIEALAARR
jgi:magnesium chelatase accessory protein